MLPTHRINELSFPKRRGHGAFDKALGDRVRGHGAF
jgi:hypothetical protein